jgi:hypothetical protein
MAQYYAKLHVKQLPSAAAHAQAMFLSRHERVIPGQLQEDPRGSLALIKGDASPLELSPSALPCARSHRDFERHRNDDVMVNQFFPGMGIETAFYRPLERFVVLSLSGTRNAFMQVNKGSCDTKTNRWGDTGCQNRQYYPPP